MDFPLTPAHIRAGRALLDWSQGRLASAAGISLTTVRAFEGENRGDVEVVAGLKAIRRALEHEGIDFLRSEGDFGPGVRMRAKVPNVLRWPVKLGRFEALVIPVEWRGNEVEVYVPQRVLDDLGHIHASLPEMGYLRLYERFRSLILMAAATAIDAGRIGADRRVHLSCDDFAGQV